MNPVWIGALFVSGFVVGEIISRWMKRAAKEAE